MEDLAQSHSAKWWKQIKQLTSQVSDKSSEWFHRFIGPDQFHDCLVLANGINDFFLSHSFRLWSIPQLIMLPFHPFFFNLKEKHWKISSPIIKQGSWSCSISNKIFKEFARVTRTCTNQCVTSIINHCWTNKYQTSLSSWLYYQFQRFHHLSKSTATSVQFHSPTVLLRS